MTSRIKLFVVSTSTCLVFVLLFGARSVASYVIEVAWWKEVGQFKTWVSMLYYALAPVAAATVVAFLVLWATHARALKFAGTSLRDHKMYGRIVMLGLLTCFGMITRSGTSLYNYVDMEGQARRGLEQPVDRRAACRRASLVGRQEPQLLVVDDRVPVGRGDVDRAGHDGEAASGGGDVERGLEDRREEARPRGAEVLRYDDRRVEREAEN